MLEWVARQMMLIEAEAKVGAEKGKHSKNRRTYFSGARVRRMDTRLGTIYLYVPKLRKGGYVPFFVTERKRSELALAALVQEAFINGVSTRRIERLAQALGIENISASQVSEINKGLEDQVQAFRTRPLEEEYPFLWIDAHYDKVRVEDHVVTLALMIAHGVSGSGSREILAIEPMFDEGIRICFSAASARGPDFVSISHPATANKHKSRLGGCQGRKEDHAVRLGGCRRRRTSRKSPGPLPLRSGTIRENIRLGDRRPRDIPGRQPDSAGSVLENFFSQFPDPSPCFRGEGDDRMVSDLFLNLLKPAFVF